MFTAIGVGAQRDGVKDTVTVKVQIFDDRTKPATLVGERAFTGATLTAVTVAIRAQLEAMKAREDDTSLNQDVAGVVLAQV